LQILKLPVSNAVNNISNLIYFVIVVPGQKSVRDSVKNVMNRFDYKKTKIVNFIL